MDKKTRRRRRFGTPRYRADRGAFYIQFTWEGRQHQRRVCAATSKKDKGAQRQAERKLDRVEQGLEAGKPLSVVLNEVFGEITGHKLTFREAAPMFLQYREARRKPSTYRNDVYRLRGLCRAGWAGKYLSAITANDLMRWVSRRKTGRRSVSGATTNRDLALCSAMFRWAETMGYVTGNPVRVVERDSERGRARTMWLTVPECQSLLYASSEAFRSVLMCFLHAGVRRAELLDLEWRSVDLERREIVVEPENTKTGKVRHIPLTDQLADDLTRLRGVVTDAVGPVFRRRDGRPLTKGWVRYWLVKSLARCSGISDTRKSQVCVHVLRHSFASHLAQEGVPLHEIGYLLGHSTQYVTERYAHLAPGAGRGAISVLGRRFEGHGSSAVNELLPRYDASKCATNVPQACPGHDLQVLSA